MNILILVPSLSGGGGAERTAALLSNALSNVAGWKVSVLAMDCNEPSYTLDSKVTYRSLDTGLNRNKVIKNIQRLFRLRRLLRNGTDLVIGYTIQGGIFSCIAALGIRKIKTIVCERQDPYQFSRAKRILRDIFYHFASGAVFQTADAQGYFKSIVKDSIVIPNFLSVENMPQPLEWPDRKNIIVTAGRLENAKNHKVLISAFAKIASQFPDYCLEIFGEGRLYAELADLIAQQGMQDRVILRGRKRDIFDYLKYAKLFVLSSNYEGYPNALLEALALGIPSISTDCPCGGPRAMICHGRNGLLIPVNDEAALSEAMISVLNNQSLAMCMSKEACSVRTTNSTASIIEQWLVYIRHVVAK